MPTTSNFGWTTPADTDLVKDGAAAIRTLGNGIDTSLVDLKGGTTGQVLSKASNTDLDYTWVTTDDANAIQNAIVDAKGDLIAASANDTPARLAVGNNGDTLLADSSTATGLKWGKDPVSDLVTTAGDTLYATAADTLTKLGIGTAGQVLKVNSGATAPEWGSVSTTKSFSLINAGGTALTGAATITVSSISGMDELLIFVDDASSGTGGSDFTVQINADTGTNYYRAGGVINADSTYSASQFTQTGTVNSDSIRFAKMGSNASATVSGGLRISGANAAGVKPYTVLAAGNGGGGNQQQHIFQMGIWTGTATITSISIISSTGNFDAGTIYVYGAA